MPGAIYRTVLMSKQQKVKRSGFGLNVNCFYFEFKLSISPHTVWPAEGEMHHSALIAVMLHPVHKASICKLWSIWDQRTFPESWIWSMHSWLIPLSWMFLKCSAWTKNTLNMGNKNDQFITTHSGVVEIEFFWKDFW